MTAVAPYTVVDDVTLAILAIFVVELIDEMSDAPPPVSASIDWPGLMATGLDGGIVCISGRVPIAFPKLATTTYHVPFVVHAEGCADIPLVGIIDATSVLPLIVAAPPLRRAPVAVLGTVVHDTVPPRAPIAGALITSVDDPASPPAEHALVLRTRLRAAHAAGTNVVVTPLPTAGAPIAVSATAPSGSTAFMVSDRSSLAAPSLIRIGAEPAWEYAAVTAVAPVPLPMNTPGLVTLSAPLIRGAELSAPVQVVTAGAAGASAALTRDSAIGDGLLMLNAVLTGATVEVADANPANVEYAAVGAVTDANGAYRADGIGRLSTVFFIAAATGETTSAPAPVTLDLDHTTSRLDFRLTP